MIRSKANADECFVSHGFLEARDIESGETVLQRFHYKWDKVCPMFVSCVPEDRGQFSETELVRNDKFIMQVCVGNNLFFLCLKKYRTLFTTTN